MPVVEDLWLIALVLGACPLEAILLAVVDHRGPLRGYQTNPKLHGAFHQSLGTFWLMTEVVVCLCSHRLRSEVRERTTFILAIG